MSLADSPDVRRIVSKWGKFVEGIDGVDPVPGDKEFTRSVAAKMLENEVEYLRKLQDDESKPWMKPGWKEEEPSIVERIAGLEDPEIAKRMQDWDDWVKAGRPRRPSFKFPGIHRSTVNPISTPIVSVQPMPQPVGGIAFYRPRYGSTNGQITR